MAELINKSYYGDFNTFWLDDGQDRLFRMLVYKRMFTPYEQGKAYMDESQFEDTYYQYVFIREVIELGNGDYLLGVQQIDIDMGDIFQGITYYRLSEIRLSYNPDDINELRR